MAGIQEIDTEMDIPLEDPSESCNGDTILEALGSIRHEDKQTPTDAATNTLTEPQPVINMVVVLLCLLPIAHEVCGLDHTFFHNNNMAVSLAYKNFFLCLLNYYGVSVYSRCDYHSTLET
jgi:hypothetical protein